jgi:methylenetetrahydrofolate reductase (NADPH)
VAALAGLLRRGDRALAPAASAALARLVREPTFELLPLKSIAAQIDALPAAARVSVTASPGKGLEATIDLAADLARRGFHAVPHLSARMVRDRAHLADVLSSAAEAGLARVFVVGGDAQTLGDFPDGLALLRGIHEVGPVPAAIGIPCYPDGHAFIPDAALATALRDKAPYAQWMTTQLCFDPVKIVTWLGARRAEGLRLPAVIGLPGVTEPHRLLAISARIGVRDTRRFLAKNLGFVARLARTGGFYRPDGLLRALGPAAADPAMAISGLHLYTFNQVAATEAWRRETLERLTSP